MVQFKRIFTFEDMLAQAKFIRTCQSCGYEHEDTEPASGKQLPDSFVFKPCKKCRSQDLDYGSRRLPDIFLEIDDAWQEKYEGVPQDQRMPWRQFAEEYQRNRK